MTAGRIGSLNSVRLRRAQSAFRRRAPNTGGEEPTSARLSSATGSEATGQSPTSGVKLYSRRRRAPRMGTVGKLAGFHALVVASVLAIVAFQLTMEFSSRYRTTITRDLYENVAVFDRAAATRPPSQSLPAFAKSYLAAHGATGGDQLAISLPAYHKTLGSPGLAALMAVPAVRSLSVSPPTKATIETVTVSGTPELLLAVPITSAGKTVGIFFTTGSLRNYEAVQRRVIELAVAEGIITVIAAFVSVYLLLRRLLGTVRRLTRTAAGIGLEGDLAMRLDAPNTRDEVGEMAATFNAMIDKIESTMTAQKQMMANISHQLRTPLTAARGHLEVMSSDDLANPASRKEIVATVVDELDHMRRMVERLLLLGRSIEGDLKDACPVDVRSLILDVDHVARGLARRRWVLGDIPDVVIHADLDKLRSALFNLVDNAAKATGETDTVKLSARIQEGSHATYIEIIVDDSGPGIPKEVRTTVLDRFGRAAQSPPGGSGLGLAIVSAIARAHRGYVDIGDSPLGGCRAVIAVPVSEDSWTPLAQRVEGA